MFFQMSFSHNKVSILGKPEGKEKQDCLEYNVSKATALWFYGGCSKPELWGELLSGAWGATPTASTPQLERLESTGRTLIPSNAQLLSSSQ